MEYDEIKKALTLIESPVEKLEMVMDLGKNLKAVPNDAKCTEILGCSSFVQICENLFVTNKKLLQKGIDNKCCNGILIKLNQIGTVTETLETIHLAQANNYKIAVSHRSGETSDTFISDLAVATNADYIKAGSMSRGERVAKYNRLMEIEG